MNNISKIIKKGSTSGVMVTRDKRGYIFPVIIAQKVGKKLMPGVEIYTQKFLDSRIYK